MKNLTYHNLVAGWRHILRYRVQNIVSVLCLSVGIVCFAIMLFCCNLIWHNQLKQQLDRNVHPIVTRPWTVAFADSLRQLPCVEGVQYESGTFSTNIVFCTTDGNPIVGSMTTMHVVSAEWLREHNFYSTVTGRPVDTVKPGDVLMSDHTRQSLGLADANPVGYRMQNTVFGPVTDVITSDTYVGNFDGVYLVGGGNQHTMAQKEMGEYALANLNIRLKDGADMAQFHAELETAHPNANIHLVTKNTLGTVMLFLIIVILGSSVLLIGLSGYLKMQIQLFTLRSREMALRRYNGAHPRQLFWLYCAELLIVAIATACIIVLVMSGMRDFAVDRMTRLGLTSMVCLRPGVIYGCVAGAYVFTFLLATVVSWFSLRRVLNRPIAQTAGRSFAHKSAFSHTMQVAQYATATILFFVVLWIMYIVGDSIESRNLSCDVAQLKEIAVPTIVGDDDRQRADFAHQMLQCPSVDMSSRYFRVENIVKHMPGDTIPEGWKHTSYREERPDSTIRSLSFCANPELFLIYNCNIMREEEIPQDSISLYEPVYAFPAEARQMASALGVGGKGKLPAPCLLPDSMEYVLVGWSDAPAQERLLHNMPDYYVVASDTMFASMADGQCSKAFRDGYMHSGYVMVPRDGDMRAMQQDVAGVYDRMFPDRAGHYRLLSAFDQWADEFLIYEVIIQICSLVSLVSLLCIILTVYSSVSLETRGRQKEIAIRKVNGAKVGDIVRLLSRSYVRTLGIAFLLSFVTCIGVIVVIGISVQDNLTPKQWGYVLGGFLASTSIVTVVTILTMWQKIYKVAHTNAAAYLTYQ